MTVLEGRAATPGRALRHAAIGVGILVGVGLLAWSAALAFYDVDGIALSLGVPDEVRRIFTGDFLTDSWHLMDIAGDWWQANRERSDLYSQLLIESQLRFQYAPIMLAPTVLISRLGLDPTPIFDAATYPFLVVTIVAVYAIARRSLAASGITMTSLGAKLGLAGITVVATLGYFPVVLSAGIGQVQLWINALFALTLWAVLAQRERIAGLLMGIASLLKPQYGLVVVWGILRRRWRFTIWAAVVAVLGTLAGAIAFGWGNSVDYVRALSFLSQRGEGFILNQSVNGLLNRIAFVGSDEPAVLPNGYPYIPPFTWWIYAATVLTTAAIVALILIRRRRSPATDDAALDLSVMMLGLTIASPIAWTHHFGILLPIFALIWPRLWYAKRYAAARWMRITVAVAFVVSGNFFTVLDVFSGTYLSVLQSTTFAAVVAVFVVLLWMDRRSPSPESSVSADAAIERSTQRSA